ncbi:MAG: hypothetical protein LBE76_00780 [Nitrososphaerota archaeon]|jgi:hypothetical protein|nr:hypothetical protein [Nitrososphaerota archaeon]
MQTTTQQEQTILQIDTANCGYIHINGQPSNNSEGFVLVTTERFAFIHIEKNRAFREGTTIDEMLQARKENYAIPNNKVNIIIKGDVLIAGSRDLKIGGIYQLSLDKKSRILLVNQLKQIYGEEFTYDPKGLL